MNETFTLSLPGASDIAHRVDALFLFMLILTGAVAIGIASLILAFSVHYRRGARVDRSAAPAGHRVLEYSWTAIPLAIFIGLFVWGAILYTSFYEPAPAAMPVYVVAKQWMWKLEHSNGRREIDELHLPLGRPVRLILASQDVIHSFYVPAFRIKQDLVPGRYTSIGFTPTELGSFRLDCAEYCGTDHARMGGRIVVMQPAEFERWLSEGAATGMAAHGFELFRTLGCSGCHGANSTVHAPHLEGLFGRVVHLQDGRTRIADEQYVRDSILLPAKDVVAGFAPIMPSFQGQASEEDLMDLIAYVRSIGPSGGAR